MLRREGETFLLGTAMTGLLTLREDAIGDRVAAESERARMPQSVGGFKSADEVMPPQTGKRALRH